MTRRATPIAPSQSTVKRLFGKSSNQCAFPKCTAALVQGDTVVGEMCHIRAASPNGPRFDPLQTPEERHGYDNLILLCANHHTIIDDDPEAYSVLRLEKMKADHENHARPLASDELDRGARLLVDQSVASAGQSGGITAQTVHQTINVQLPTVSFVQCDERPSIINRACKFHRSRVEQIANGQAPVKLQAGGALVLHVRPFSAVEERLAVAFSEIARNPHRFPPVRCNHVPRSQIDRSGLIIGSNADGLAKAQRAYVKVFRSSIIESVVTSLARGVDNNFLILPDIQEMIIKYVSWYLRSLNSFAVRPPTVVCASLINVQGMRLLQDYQQNCFLEDMPFAVLDDNIVEMEEATVETTPSGYLECAHMLLPMLTHLANASGLSSPPYFDKDGNYLAML